MKETLDIDFFESAGDDNFEPRELVWPCWSGQVDDSGRRHIRRVRQWQRREHCLGGEERCGWNQGRAPFASSTLVSILCRYADNLLIRKGEAFSKCVDENQKA